MFSAYVRYLGIQSGEGQRGRYYNFSFMLDGETYSIRCSEEVAIASGKLSFGDEVTIHLELRNYRGDWFPRIVEMDT